MAPLERLAVRQISARFLSQDERIEIADLHHSGWSIRQIAPKLGRAPSTVSRELRRNGSGRRGYLPFEAHRLATARRGRFHLRRVETDAQLRELIADLLMQRWSPQQIQPSPTPPVSGQPAKVAVSREHLPSRLPAWFAADASVAAGPAPAFTASHRSGSSTRPAQGRAPPAAV